ncbi:MAG: hypothetical protein WBS19_13135 [Candidatus Korobacteraceae bacterium]
MAETGGANIEIAHKLNEAEEHGPHHKSKWIETLEIAEAIILAMVAIATAWSGYQAALWDGRQDERYEQSTRLRVEAQGMRTLGDQERIYDAMTFADWLKAAATGDQKVAHLFERRFRPEFRVAYDVWLKTDPLNNPNAPPGPQLLPEYHNTELEKSAKLTDEASEVFEEGTKARETSDMYVRVTVLLATVLLLTAIAQRFKTHQVRMGLAVVAFLLVCIPLYRILTLPRL